MALVPAPTNQPIKVEIADNGNVVGSHDGWFFALLPSKASNEPNIYYGLVQGGEYEALASATDAWTAKRGFNKTHHTLRFHNNEFERVRSILCDMGYRQGQLLDLGQIRRG